VEPAPFWKQWLGFEAHCWGEPNPSPSNPYTQYDLLYDFNSCIELVRELAGAMYRNAGGVPNIRLSDTRWEQPGDDNRYGRLLVLPFAIGSDLADEPWTILPQSSAPQPGSSFQPVVTVQALFPDGSSSVAGTFTIP
jgi:hypothetical protein